MSQDMSQHREAERLQAECLYDPREEHDACGVGLVASIDGEPRREVVEAGIAAAHEQVEWILANQPVLAAIHPWDAEGPDEEIMLMEHAFLSHVPESGANLPSYRAWLR